MNRKIIAILTISAAVRLFGIWFGLPDLYHADEPIIVNHAISYGSGDLNPHFFNIPPLVSYLLYFVYGIYFVIGRLIGLFEDSRYFLYVFVTNPTPFYLIARILFGALLGTASVYFLYRLVKRFFTEEHALLGALFFGLNFLHVRDSHYIYTDIPLILILILGFFPIMNLIVKIDRKTCLIFGCLLGIAVATKYNGVFILVPFLVIYLSRQGLKLGYLLEAIMLSVLMYAILNPFSLIDFKFFLSELFEQKRSEGLIGFFHHLTYSLAGSLGWPLLIFSLFGMLKSFFQKDLKLISLTSFVLFYYFVLSIASQPYDRYTLPIIPFLIVLAVEGVILIKQRFKLSPVLVSLVILGLLFPSAGKIYASSFLLLKDDTRKIAKDWFERSVPDGMRVVLDTPFYLPRLKPTLGQLIEQRNESSDKRRLKLEAMIRYATEIYQPRYELFFMSKTALDGKDSPASATVPYDFSILKENKIEYVVTRDLYYLPEQFTEAVKKNCELVARFTPYRDDSIESEFLLDPYPLTGTSFLWRDLSARKRNGPIICIYRMKT